MVARYKQQQHLLSGKYRTKPISATVECPLLLHIKNRFFLFMKALVHFT